MLTKLDHRTRTRAPALRRSLALACAAFVVFSGASCRQIFKREVSSAVLAIGGAANATFGGKAIAVSPNEWILPGTRIVTASGSRLDLMLLPGILIELAGDTEVEITRLRFRRDGDETIRPMRAREASLRLVRGTLIAATGESQMRSRIFIESPAGDLTAFDLRTFKFQLEGNRARVTSVRSKVQFKPAGVTAPVTIDAGYFGEWPSTTPGPRAVAGSEPA